MSAATRIPSSIFRAYDIRGVVGESLTEANVTLIGKAIGSLIRESGHELVTVGRDGRLSGPALCQALVAGLLTTGCDVVDIGLVPTPLVYFATHVYEGRSGVMLTGSHNPGHYNGMKIVLNGSVLAEENLQKLYARVQQGNFVTGHGVYHQQDLADRYIRNLIHNISMGRPLKVVIDAGNGATATIAPALYRALGCEVIELFCEVDGHFPNHHPDPSQEENLQALIAKVQATQADIGLAFDGDGDRLGVVTSSGEIIYPDRLLMLYAQAILAKHPQAKIIYDVKCTNHLEKVIKALGGEPIMWKTGHALIKAKMAESNAQLAGEMSGHFFFKDKWFGFDDALYAGARLLEILSQQTKSSDALFAEIPNSVNTPELKVEVDEAEKFDLMQALIAHADFDEAHLSTIDGLRVSFAEGWGLVRPSNTTPCLVMRFEADNSTMLEKIQQRFREWMLSVSPELDLPF